MELLGIGSNGRGPEGGIAQSLGAGKVSNVSIPKLHRSYSPKHDRVTKAVIRRVLPLGLVLLLRLVAAIRIIPTSIRF